MGDSRVVLRRRGTYRTRSNRIRKVKTPGGKLVAQYIKKTGKIPRCGDTGHLLNGIAAVRSKELAKLSKPKKSVTRIYGGCLSAGAVRTRIIRAFLIEEKQIVKKAQKSQKRGK
uniref:60S ribosomal protein L34 n=1 Tax=Rhodosorus marinus TaxID=101924 RepID=A0A7S0G4T0_9RHOD|mmetsp:Transcript_23724/g.34098  ORF Transcript_23724/g.34098 Transcript_23724/m.34098 type:complete len:114 (+) Transcript_23724:127-468(+)